MNKLPVLDADSARRLFLGAQGLLSSPSSPDSGASLLALVMRLGFVQVDTVNVVARAHDLTLHARQDAYRPDRLKSLLEHDRSLFEHWTHDASVIPAAWYPHWKPRFRRDRARIEAHPWWRRLLGEHSPSVCNEVLRRIRDEGPLRSTDFEHPGARGPWWGWKPAKAALDYLWRTGELAVAGRTAFQKRYDLPERVFPGLHDAPEPDPSAHAEWVFSTAAERLAVFTARELAAFWNALETKDASSWCASAVSQGRLVEVSVESADDDKARAAFTFSDWSDRLRTLPSPPDRVRLLSPFDPILRDRDRCRRRFGFEYTVEMFTPASRRRYGYYALPILEGDRFVGRLDAKLHRDRKVLEVRGLWWERGVRASRRRTAHLHEALHRLAAFASAHEVVFL